LPQRLAFRQVLASGDKRGAVAATDAKAMLVKLETGAEPSNVGDGSMLPSAVPLTTKTGVAALFGDDFAAAVFAHEGTG
jgi:hypothetical protein